MNFNDNYKNQIDKISIDSDVRANIIEKINEPKHRSKAPYVISSIAVACAVLAISFYTPVKDLFVTPDDTKQPENVNSKQEEVIEDTTSPNIAEDYTSVYDKIKELTDKVNDNEMIDDGVILYEGALAGNAVATDTAASAKPGVSANSANKGYASMNSANAGASSNKSEYSETTTQVEGVDEADVVKTDGKYIYVLSKRNYKLRIIKAGKEPKQVATIPLDELPSYDKNLYLSGDRLVIYGTRTENKTPTKTEDSIVSYSQSFSDRNIVYGSIRETVSLIYDISNPEKPKKVIECVQDGACSDSRLIGDKLYMISNYNIVNSNVDMDKPETYVPTVYCGESGGAIKADCIYINPDVNSLCYTVICGYDVTDGKIIGTQSILGGTYTVYCSTENIIAVGNSGEETRVTRYAINDGKVVFKAEGSIKGSLLNQFSIDEYKGYFRFVTTEQIWRKGGGETVFYSSETSNSLYVLDDELKQVGSITDLAPDERVYSVRFMGDVAYFVTFRQVDPLFSADLSDPKDPKIIGKLKIPGFSNYMYPYGDGKLLGIGQDADEKTGRTGNVKLSMFDISDPSNVTEGSKKILDISYSEALYNHKAILVDFEKNLIAFDGYTNTGMVYNIYEFKNEKFKLLKQIKIDLNGNEARSLYIGEEFYIITEQTIWVYDINTFEEIFELNHY